MAFPNGKIPLDQYLDPVLGMCYVGQTSGPGTLKFRKGVVFFVFLSERGAEEVHIGCARPGSKCDAIGRTRKQNGSVDRYVVELQSREDDEGQTYYMAIVQDDSLDLDFDDGFKFVVVTKDAHVELHIVPLRTSGFKIDLDPRNDAQQQIFYVGRNQWSLILHFKRGAAFSIYLSEDGNEELEITRPKSGDTFLPLRRRIGNDGIVDKYIVPLERRVDDSNRPFYYGVVQDELDLDMEAGFVFLVFTSKPGKEELQISKNREASTRDNQKPDIAYSRTPDSDPRKTETGEYPRVSLRRNNQVA